MVPFLVEVSDHFENSLVYLLETAVFSTVSYGGIHHFQRRDGCAVMAEL
jgi:hypothetical protein